MDNKDRGKYGEDLAVSFLEEKGFEILERNHRYKKGEIDIIALLQNELLVFFEVKNRKSNSHGEPESFVSNQQKRLIISGAESYIFDINWQKDIRFDIITITGNELVHIEDAFY
ncbi:MAG: YraN family protein [Cyclobacteriaceae bacterium]